MKKIAILQSNYIPWKGYFDIIATVDEFILFDDVQYTRRDWRNRNQIKTAQGVRWLTIPVKVKGKYDQKVREVEIANSDWRSIHWKTLCQNYYRAPFFKEITSWLEPLYLEQDYSLLSEVNRRFIEEVCSYLEIDTVISNSWDYEISGAKTERLAYLCQQAGGSEYLSGPSAKSYLDEDAFRSKGIQVEWFDYSNYPEYTQMAGRFIHEVSILDLLFNCGEDSHKYIRRTMT